VHDPAGYPSYAPDQHWAEPNLDHAVKLLREVAEAPGDASERARQIRERYRPDRIASAFRAAVDTGFPQAIRGTADLRSVEPDETGR
jgi:hypothetical protein